MGYSLQGLDGVCYDCGLTSNEAGEKEVACKGGVFLGPGLHRRSQQTR